MARNPLCTNPASCDECDLAAAKIKTMGRSGRVKTNTILVGFVNKGGRTMGWETVRKEVKNFGRNENRRCAKTPTMPRSSTVHTTVRQKTTTAMLPTARPTHFMTLVVLATCFGRTPRPTGGGMLTHSPHAQSIITKER